MTAIFSCPAPAQPIRDQATCRFFQALVLPSILDSHAEGIQANAAALIDGMISNALAKMKNGNGRNWAAKRHSKPLP